MGNGICLVTEPFANLVMVVGPFSKNGQPGPQIRVSCEGHCALCLIMCPQHMPVLLFRLLAYGKEGALALGSALVPSPARSFCA